MVSLIFETAPPAIVRDGINNSQESTLIVKNAKRRQFVEYRLSSYVLRRYILSRMCGTGSSLESDRFSKERTNKCTNAQGTCHHTGAARQVKTIYWQ